MAYFQFIHSEFKGGKVSQVRGFCQILRGESMTSGTERDIWDESKKKQKSPPRFSSCSRKNEGAKCHANFIHALRVWYQNGTVSPFLRPLSSPGDSKSLYLKQVCLVDIAPAILIILITHIVLAVRWMLIKILSAVINHHGTVITVVLGGCHPNNNIIRKTDRKIKMLR